MSIAAPFAVRDLPDPSATDRLGGILAPLLRVGDAVLLHGEIGAGKSYLVRATLQTLMAQHSTAEDIPSPTFTLVQSYQIGQTEALHADLYRLNDISEVVELGLLDAFPTALVFVEWPDRLGTLTPQNALHVGLTLNGDGRRVTFSALSRDWAKRLGLPDVI